MQVLKLIEQYCSKNPLSSFVLDQELGVGHDGQAFELKNENNQAIKLGLRYLNDTRAPLIANEKAIRYIINNPFPHYVNLFSFTNLGTYSRPWNNNKYLSFNLYYYTMEKLEKISDDEKKVFHSLVCHEDLNKRKDYSSEEIKLIAKDLNKGLDFNYNKVLDFCLNYKHSLITYPDLHIRNIMKDNSNNFKLVDMDHIKFK